MIERLLAYLSKMVNQTMAMHQLLTAQQGTRSLSDFMQVLERNSKILNFEKKLYTIEETIKDASIFGMNESVLKEKGLAEDLDLKKLTW